MNKPTVERVSRMRQAGLILGPLLAVLCYALLPETYTKAQGQPALLSHAARATLAMMLWMALWWMSEAVPIEATALLPIVLFPLQGIASLAAAAAPYASDIVFLFLGGFVLAAAIQRWGVDRRIAWSVLRVTGARQDRIVAGVMAVTAFLSLWVSNTATAAMMLPIALAIIAAADVHQGERNSDFGIALLLSVAYAASLGGIGTLIGSPPNGIAARFITQTYGREFSFLDWLAIGLPVMLIMLPLTWLLLTRVLFRVHGQSVARAGALAANELSRLGPMSRGARATIAVFAITVLLWTTRPWLVQIQLGGQAVLSGLTDAGIAVGAALALFLLPAGDGTRVMHWDNAATLPWGVLILIGGGLSLAAAIEANGAAQFIASGAAHLGGWPVLALVLVVVAATVFLSELTSNTAQVAIMLPILAALAPGLGVDPMLLILPCTLAASCAFMMPVGTPPNAIIFGSGLISIARMCKTGVWLNLVAIVVITLMCYALIPLRLRE